MPGFLIGSENIKSNLQNEYPKRCLQQEIETPIGTVKRNTLNKFMLDKAFVQTADYVIIAEGYLLNKKALFDKYKKQCMEDLIAQMYEKNGETFFSEFRGGFSGSLYDKKNELWLVWTNQTGDAPVFYSYSPSFFFAGSQVNYILDALKEKKVPLSLNENAAYQMLTFAFMENDETYAKEIRRLRGGTYIIFKNGSLDIKEYYRFEKHPERFKDKTDAELVELIDKAFSRAVKMEYDKDIEYGYKHLADLSGGLDSRMNVWIAEELGYHPIQTLTFCKANYLDEIIAKQIAAYWKNPLLVKPIDDVGFMRDTDSIVRMTNGLSLYTGITGGKAMLESLNMAEYGLEHTGMIGDAVIGSLYTKPSDAVRKYPSGKYSEKLIARLKEKKHPADEDHELYLLYTRCLHGAVNTYLLRQNFTEVVSPFMDVEFLQLCMDIPAEKRINHHLYKIWILQKHPEAAQFIWEKTGCKVSDSELKVQTKRLFEKGPRKLAKILNLHIPFLEKAGMNPIDYWIDTDPQLESDLTDKFTSDFEKMPEETSQQLREDIKMLFNTGNAMEKSMAMTVTAACAYYFGGSNECRN